MRLRGGNTLVSTMAVLVIIAILMVAMMKGSNLFGAPQSPRADGRGTTVPGLVKAKAEDTVCRDYLRNLRMSLEIAKTSNDDQWPTTLEDTRLGKTYYSCPMGKGKEPYTYDPATGEVHCIHPGHEKY